jgi:predicted nuclease with TOPRIM domain
VKLVKDYDECQVELDEINEHACHLDEAITKEKHKFDELEDRLLKETQKASNLIEMIVDLKNENKELKVAHEKLNKEVELMDVGSKDIKSELVSITSSHEELKASHAKMLNMPSTSNASNPVDIDAYVPKDNLVEATLKKENVELKA